MGPRLDFKKGIPITIRGEYMPSKAEHPYALSDFFGSGYIRDVAYMVRSGKEATIYCCEAHPSTGHEFLAAKVYRSKNSRSFKNDAIYQQGRVILDRRSARAFRKKTKRGRIVQSQNWVSAEYETMCFLYDAGASIPMPFAHAGNSILMEYLGNGEAAAPMLRETRLPAGVTRRAFASVIDNIELFLAGDIVHGDLSAFNILYWNGDIHIIDFPQAVDARMNPNAYALLERDIANVGLYFSKYGIRTDSSQIPGRLWSRFQRAQL